MSGVRSLLRQALQPRWVALSFTPFVVWALASAPATLRTKDPGGPVTLSLVGTTDLHGQIFSTNGRGGLSLLGGYLENLRAARAADGGAVLLFDSGDTYLDGIESNLSEGAAVVDAYNALGYTAAAIGNHDFDFGATDPSRLEPGSRCAWYSMPSAARRSARPASRWKTRAAASRSTTRAR